MPSAITSKNVEDILINVVRVTGIEPARVTSLDPKSSASASSAIPAGF